MDNYIGSPSDRLLLADRFLSAFVVSLDQVFHGRLFSFQRFPGAPPVSGQGYYPQAHPGMHPQPGMAPLMAGAPMTYPPQGGQFAGYGQQFAMQMAQVPVPPATQPPPPSVTAAQTAAPPPPQSQTTQQQQQQQQAAAAAAAAAAQQPPATVAAGAPPGQPRPGPGQTPPTFHQPPQQVRRR